MAKTKKEKYKVKARRFYLLRNEDESGVSGTGIVGEGVEFLNGMVALSFTSPYQHVNVYANLHAAEEVHGHRGKTQFIFIDNPDEF